jgi:hypothetical protein
MRKHNTLPEEGPMELVKVCGPTEAEMIAEVLRNNGIDCTLQGELSANTLPATGDLDEVRIWVESQDAVRASGLIDAFFTPVSKDELSDASQELGSDDPDDKGGFTV